MKKGKDNCNAMCLDYSYVVLRVLLGLLMFVPGVMKLMGVMNTGTTGVFSMVGPFLGWIVIVVEIVAGLAVIVGYQTKWAAYPLALILVVATIMTSNAWLPPNSSTFFHLIAAVAFIYIAQIGSGKCSVDAQLK
jgi:putative oxidoreductase